MHEIVLKLNDITDVMEIWQGLAGLAVVCDAQSHVEVRRRLSGYDFVLCEAPTEVPEDRSDVCLFHRPPPQPTSIAQAWSPPAASGVRVRSIQSAPSGASDAMRAVVHSGEGGSALVWVVRVASHTELAAIGPALQARAQQLGRKVEVLPEWMYPVSRLSDLDEEGRETATLVEERYGRAKGVRGIFIDLESTSQVCVWLENQSCVREFNRLREADPLDGVRYQLRLVIPFLGQSLLSLIPPNWVCIANLMTSIHGRCRWCNAKREASMHAEPCGACGAEGLPSFTIAPRSKKVARVDVYLNPDSSLFVEFVQPDEAGDAGMLSKTVRWELPPGTKHDHLPFGRKLS